MMELLVQSFSGKLEMMCKNQTVSTRMFTVIVLNSQLCEIKLFKVCYSHIETGSTMEEIGVLLPIIQSYYCDVSTLFFLCSS